MQVGFGCVRFLDQGEHEHAHVVPPRSLAHGSCVRSLRHGYAATAFPTSITGLRALSGQKAAVQVIWLLVQSCAIQSEKEQWWSNCFFGNLTVWRRRRARRNSKDRHFLSTALRFGTIQRRHTKRLGQSALPTLCFLKGGSSGPPSHSSKGTGKMHVSPGSTKEYTGTELNRILVLASLPSR